MEPDTLHEVMHKVVGTGYYVYYHDKKGHADFSHASDPMKFEATHSPPWICLVQPKLFPDTQLVVMNAYFGADPASGTCDYVVRLRNGAGKILRERCMPPLPPRGSARFGLTSAFEDIAGLAAMLPERAWRHHEPRFGFPVFKGIRSMVSFSIRPDCAPFVFSKVKSDIKLRIKQGWRS